MPWPRQEPDPLQVHRRKLEHQQQELTKEVSRLTAQLQKVEKPLPSPVKAPEPPVWRLDDEAPPVSTENPARRRALARQRGRDRLIFFICMGLLLVAFAVWLWVYYTHASGNGGI